MHKIVRRLATKCQYAEVSFNKRNAKIFRVGRALTERNSNGLINMQYFIYMFILLGQELMIPIVLGKVH